MPTPNPSTVIATPQPTDLRNVMTFSGVEFDFTAV
jgi:hypothetical protein